MRGIRSGKVRSGRADGHAARMPRGTRRSANPLRRRRALHCALLRSAYVDARRQCPPATAGLRPAGCRARLNRRQTTAVALLGAVAAGRRSRSPSTSCACSGLACGSAQFASASVASAGSAGPGARSARATRPVYSGGRVPRGHQKHSRFGEKRDRSRFATRSRCRYRPFLGRHFGIGLFMLRCQLTPQSLVRRIPPLLMHGARIWGQVTFALRAVDRAANHSH